LRFVFCFSKCEVPGNSKQERGKYAIAIGSPDRTFKDLYKNKLLFTKNKKGISQGLNVPCKGHNQATIDAPSCFGHLTSLLELTLKLFYCEGLSDLHQPAEAEPELEWAEEGRYFIKDINMGTYMRTPRAP
jgi:hypothetical protein